MNHFEQQPTALASEKLSSNSILPSFPENESIMSFSDQRSSPNELYQQQNVQNVVSPPLTPAVSPPSMLMDNLKYQRKYSVDVGPFGFGSGNVMLPHYVLQEEYRRGSTCSSDITNQSLHLHRQQNSSPPLQQMNNPVGNYPFLQSSPIDPFSVVDNPYSTEIMQKKTNSLNSDLISNADDSLSQQKSRRPSRLIGQHGPNTQHKHVCKYSYCGWSFKRYEHLKRHMLVHTGERPHVCPFQGCGKSFSRSDNFHAHYRTHTKKALIQQNSSYVPSLSTGKPITKKQSKRQQQQQQHQQQQEQSSQQQRPMFMPDYDRMGMNPYEMYDQRPSIYSHQDHHQFMRPYDINPPYQASPAPFSTSANTFSSDADSTTDHSFNGNIDVTSPFYSPPSVTELSLTASPPSHNSSSTTDKESPIKTHCCPVHQCQRKFKRLEHLKRHMRIHTMERPFACTSCNKTFSRSDNLSQHQKTHTRPAPSTKPNSSDFMHHQQDPIWSSSMKNMEY
ncbi:hypothetical protein [Absidia glauca]|uniref:C2H2-type domain-containing protein n=1 Tax=Absidia glauca TaxID=4829 RepID=A0A163J2E0_ABSGL|nr:hypothetical protein [Absidia glauca]